MILALLAFACNDGQTNAPAASPTPTAAPVSTGSDEPRASDLIDLAQRHRGAGDLPMTVTLPEPGVGDQVEFNVLMLPPDPEVEPEFRTLTADLAVVSEHAYFFVENGEDVAQTDIDASAAAFEDEIWPVVTGAFGPPPTPGVDGDDRIAVLHADLGGTIGGYVSGSDGYPKAVVSRSNEREMIYMNLQAVAPGSPTYTYVLAHELQHLSHLALDPDESAWVNEGLSEFAAQLVSGPSSSFGAFLDQPDTQLNAWDDVGGSAAHYKASSLFFQYLFEQTGGDAGGLAAFPENGVLGVETFLAALAWPDTVAALVGDWAAANFVDAPTGPYGYGALDVSSPATEDAESSGEGEVHQFATDYLKITADEFRGSPTFSFKGSDTVPAIAAQEAADGGFWWSGRGDAIDSTLTREVDLTDVPSAKLTFRLWHDIERWYDYAYVSVSEDGGATWTALDGVHTTTDDPVEVAYGAGYSGATGGWVDEEVDLTPYAGSQVQLRFEYVTDGALQEPGFAIDDIAIPSIGFFDDGSDAGGWHREGFRVLSEPLEQSFELRLITLGSPFEAFRVLVEDNSADITLDGLGVDYQSAVIAVVPTTDGTTEPADYRYDVTAAPESG